MNQLFAIYRRIQIRNYEKYKEGVCLCVCIEYANYKNKQINRRKLWHVRMGKKRKENKRGKEKSWAIKLAYAVNVVITADELRKVCKTISWL